VRHPLKPLALLAVLVLAAPGALRAGETPQPESAVPGGASKAAAAPKSPVAEPEHVVVQHILVGFAGSVPGTKITRTTEEARTLAEELLARARKGEDFDSLVKQYTADSAPGIYGLANTGVQPGTAESSRGRMVKGFGDTSFSLAVGEVGMAAYDPKTSPYGWHIVKRLK